MQVMALDKQTGRVFKTHTRNIAAQTGFCDTDINAEFHSIDPLLTELEAKVAPMIQEKTSHLNYRSHPTRDPLHLAPEKSAPIKLGNGKQPEFHTPPNRRSTKPLRGSPVRASPKILQSLQRAPERLLSRTTRIYYLPATTKSAAST